jgi:hypothetical protein
MGRMEIFETSIYPEYPVHPCLIITQNLQLSLCATASQREIENKWIFTIKLTIT